MKNAQAKEMIDPFDLKEGQILTDEQLEDFIVFSVCVAGHSAKATRPAVTKLAKTLCEDPSPGATRGGFLDEIRFAGHMGILPGVLKDCGMGCFNQRAKTLETLAEEVSIGQLDLRTCTPEDLERIPGIGSKTSRFFILHTRPNQNYAVLDVHVLRYMKKLGYDVPAATPSKKKYAELEQKFLALAKKRGKTAAQLDFQIWKAGATKRKVRG